MPAAALRKRARTGSKTPLLRVLGVAGSIALLTAARPLWAQSAQTGASDASADLFREGRQLLNKGRFTAACEKFRASLELRRSPGTLLNVGNCLEGEGNLVGAFGVFEEVRALAAAEPDARKAAVWAAAAEQERASLEPRIPRLTIRQPVDATVRVTLDGRPLEAFGQPLRLDPGRHEVRASASGKQPFARRLELAEAQVESLDIPVLDPVPSLPEAAAPAPPSAASASVAADTGSPRLWPWVLIGAGGAVFAAGAVTGLVAAKMHSDLEDECPNMGCDDLSSAQRGEKTALAADVTMLAGLVTAGVGAVWLLSADESDTSLAAGCSAGVCGAELHGRF
jgi:hypothetical protein